MEQQNHSPCTGCVQNALKQVLDDGGIDNRLIGRVGRIYRSLITRNEMKCSEALISLFHRFGRRDCQQLALCSIGREIVHQMVLIAHRRVGIVLGSLSTYSVHLMKLTVCQSTGFLTVYMSECPSSSSATLSESGAAEAIGNLRDLPFLSIAISP